MDLILKIAFAVLTAAFGTMGLTRQYQMLQQNSYFLSRYFRWYKGAFGIFDVVTLILATLGAISIALGVTDEFSIFNAINTGVLIVIVLLLGIISVNKNKKSIKKLVLTARVKRMIAAASVIFSVIAVLSVVLQGILGRIFGVVLFVCALYSPVVTVLSCIFMKPVEKAIANYYVNDAKKILREHKGLKVIGITGSYGKTSTKFILGRILNERYNTLVTPENYNTPMGVVITVRNHLRPQTEIFVCEIGAKRKGDIAEVCDIADPDLGVITSVGPQHLDTFGNIETVVSTKFELADRVKKKNGKMFLNTDNGLIKAKADDYDSVTYGTADCDCKAENITYSPSGLTLTVKAGDICFDVTSKLLGLHNALNITAAAAVALHLGLTPEEIAFAVSKLKPVEHRLELKNYIGGSTLIDDAYNSNPEGCLEAVRVLGSFEGMKKILVTPGLVELGDKEYECNRRLGVEAAKYADIIILVGKKRSIPIAEGVKESGKFPADNLYTVSSFAEAVKLFTPMCDKNTVLLFENDLPDNYLQ